jgi:hypothetical protein
MTPNQSAAPGDQIGILRRASELTWEGTLHGYRVQVFECGGTWCFAVINTQGHNEVCPRVASFAEGVRRAWECVERRVVASGSG